MAAASRSPDTEVLLNTIVQKLLAAEPSCQMVAGSVLRRVDGANHDVGRVKNGQFVPTSYGTALLVQLDLLGTGSGVIEEEVIDLRPAVEARVQEESAESLTLDLDEMVSTEENAGIVE